MTNKELQELIEEVNKLKYEQGYKDGYMEGVKDCLKQFIQVEYDEEMEGWNDGKRKRSI